MYRGTTPTLKFILPVDASTIVGGYISIAQDRVVIIEKPISDWTIDGNTITTRLTQQETLRLDESCITEIQIRVKFADGTAPASQIFTVSTERILRDGVI